jgi:hypothetical protein
MKLLFTLVEEAITVICLLTFLLAIYVWSTEIGAFFYD